MWFSTHKSDSIPRLAVQAVLRGEVDGALLRNRMVLIGVSETGLAQNYANAEGGVLPGADALALSLAALLDGHSLNYPPYAIIVELLIVIVLGWALCAAIFSLSFRRLGLTLLTGTAGAFPLAVYFALVRREIVDFTLPVGLTLLLTGAAFMYLHRVQSARETRAIAERDRLIAKLRAMSASSDGNLSATMTHELRQPLTAMRNYLTAMTRLMGSDRAGARDEVSKFAARASDQAARMADIMQSVSDAVRQETTRRVTDKFDQIVLNAARDALAASPVPGARIETDIPGNLPAALVNANQVELLVKNLVRNAAEAAQQAGVEDRFALRISLAPAADDMIATSIRDNAGGVTERIGADVFDPFISDKPGGTGIGLALCRDIVEAHGGEISMTHIDDPAGTKFTFRLPTAAGVA